MALGERPQKNVNSTSPIIRNLIKEFLKTKFYVLSVNPVNEKIRRYRIKNFLIP